MSRVVYTQRLRTAIALHSELFSFRGHTHGRTTLVIAAVAAATYLEAHVTRCRRRTERLGPSLCRPPLSLIPNRTGTRLLRAGYDRKTTGFSPRLFVFHIFCKIKPRVGGRGWEIRKSVRNI